MLILQLISGFSQQELYKNFIEKLQGLGFRQKVYVPVRTAAELGKNNLPESPDLSIYYSFILRKYHRILFFLKIIDVYTDLRKKIELDNIELIHSHFLFSDGAVALKIKKELNIPYIVTVRNTDVNIFFKYMFHLRNKGVEILLNANRIIFITPAYVDVVNKYIPLEHRITINKKILIIPNGLNEFWLRNKAIKPKKKKDVLRVLYLGDFTPNKNVKSIIEAVMRLEKHGFNIKLTLVGGGGVKSIYVMRQLKKCDSKIVQFFERTNDKETLLKYYRNNDVFVMPSFKETFGIAYLEAMSQGLPIIYTKGQGVDGYFPQNPPGYAVNPYDLEEIMQCIVSAYNNLNTLSQNGLNHVDSFSWDIITEKYFEIYNESNYL